MPWLVIQSGKHRGKKLGLPDAEIEFGRDEQCQVQLASNDVSRRHCALRSTPEGIYVRDLGSRNGTLVNDVPITEETLLKPGDLLQVGPMLFQVPKVKESAGRIAVPDDSASIHHEPASDDEIASWLTGDDGSPPATLGDTTVIPNKPAPQPQAAEAEQPAAQPAPKTAKKEFRSIAEEAADIIRRHRESTGGNKADA